MFERLQAWALPLLFLCPLMLLASLWGAASLPHPADWIAQLVGAITALLLLLLVFAIRHAYHSTLPTPMPQEKD